MKTLVSPQNSQPKMVTRIFLGLICLLLISAIILNQAASLAQGFLSPSQSLTSLGQSGARIFVAGDIEYTSVYLDGFALFQIASQDFTGSGENFNGVSAVERRARRIERTLQNIINVQFDPKTLQITTATLNNLTVIVAADGQNLARQVVLTVTEIDALLDSSTIANLALRWSEIIKTALLQAWQERQPAARRQQIAIAGVIVLGMMLLSGLFLWWQRTLKRRFNQLKRLSDSQSQANFAKNHPLALDPAANPLAETANFHQKANFQRQLILIIFWKRLTQIGLILLWVGGIAAILSLFPDTRLEGRGIIRIPLRIFLIWLVLMLLSNCVNLYVNSRLREWVEEGVVFSENVQRRILRAPTLLEVWRGIIGFVAVFVGIIWFLATIGFSFGSLLTGAGLIGAILTFGFQSLLKDWINGFLIILEDQYAVGDIIEFTGIIGAVENMSIRATQMRGPDGRLITIPHNQIITAHNLSKDWSRVNFSIEVAYQTDPDLAIALMREIAEQMAVDSQWQEDIINPVQVIGVSRVTHSGIEIMLRIVVKRLRQFDIEREYRRRLKLAFDHRGIRIGIPQQSFLKTEEQLFNS
jgi:small-conductance mechanosensitive channel